MTGAPDPDQFRLAMGRFATGVTILSTLWRGHDHTMTANAIASVSMEPMLVLACVEIDARFHEAIVESGTWGQHPVLVAAAHRRLAGHAGPSAARPGSTGSRTTAERPASPSSRAPWQRLSVRPRTSTPLETTASWSGK